MPVTLLNAIRKIKPNCIIRKEVDMMKFLQVLVFLALAVPFAYMAYDVTRELLRQFNEFLSRRAKPVVINLVNMLID